MQIKNRREFIKASALAASGVFVSTSMQACKTNENAQNNVANAVTTQNEKVGFLHGVKSGDPLETAFIIWTRLTPKNNQQSVEVNFFVAKDEKFTQIIQSGTTYAQKQNDYTIKIDVQGLEPQTLYYYRFSSNGVYSLKGKAKTLPPLYSTPKSAKFAVFSCSNYPNGYFNAYKEASRLDLDFSIHLGDYIYEYGQYKDDDFDKKIPGYATKNSFKINRSLPEDNNKECLSLKDYRNRYALYSTDTGLQAIHAACPMIVVWDDHEVCDNTYKTGAGNHQPQEGDYNQRVEDALRAYFEWLPIRPIVNKRQIFRSFYFGQLFALHMLETRLFARSKQAGTLDILNVNAIKNADKDLLGSVQRAWLENQISSSNAIWQVLGQQVVMGRMYIPIPAGDLLFGSGVNLIEAVKDVVNGAYTGVYTKDAQKLLGSLMKILRNLRDIKQKMNRGEEVSIFDKNKVNTKYPYNIDAWDGYHKEREKLLSFIQKQDINLVVLSGDTHNSWANNITTDDGTNVGVEFAGTSVSSPGMEEYLGSLKESEILELEEIVQYLVDDLEYCNLKDRGFLEVTFTKDEAICDYHYVSSNLSTNYSMLKDRHKRFVVKAGMRKLKA